MELSNKRKEQAILTKRKLFLAAVKLIKEKGYDNVAVSEICQNANVAKGTFYLYYKAKEDIIKELYYADMNDYMHKKYSDYLNNNPLAPLNEQIFNFLLFELKFADYVGLELTSLAFGINLNQCSKGVSNHFQRREFSHILQQLLAEAAAQQLFITTLNDKQLLLYIETMVRGLMASWCFANNSFNLEETGKLFLKTYLNSILRSDYQLI